MEDPDQLDYRAWKAERKKARATSKKDSRGSDPVQGEGSKDPDFGLTKRGFSWGSFAKESAGVSQAPYWVWWVSKRRLEAQWSGIRLYLQNEVQRYQAIYPISARTDEHREFIRQLEIQVARCQVGLEELESWPGQKKVRRKGLWDRLVIKLHEWVGYQW